MVENLASAINEVKEIKTENELASFKPENPRSFNESRSSFEQNYSKRFYETQKSIQEKTVNDILDGKQDIDKMSKLEKGNFGEMVTDFFLSKLGYERLSQDRVTSLTDKTHEGIDGVYYKKGGHPPYLIVDAKFGSADLNPNTADGKQMSESWIDKRLDAAVGKELADKIRMEKLLHPENVGSFVSKVDSLGNVRLDRLDGNANVIEKGVKV